MGIQIDNLPEWLLEPSWIRFAEDEPEDTDDDDDADDAEEDDDDEEDDAEKAAAKKSKEAEDTSGLKSALQKERSDRKRLEKEAKELRRFKETAERKGKSETDNAKADATKASQKAEKLAAKLQTNEVDLTIIKVIQSDPKLKFRDIDDALSLVKRGDIEVEQDEDDPSEIDVDSDSVVKALQALARRKPHLLVDSSNDEDEEDEEDEDVSELELIRRSRRSATGSKVGSRGTRDKGKITDEKLYETYPALAAGRPSPFVK